MTAEFVQTIEGPRRKPLSGREISGREESSAYLHGRGWDTGLTPESVQAYREIFGLMVHSWNHEWLLKVALETLEIYNGADESVVLTPSLARFITSHLRGRSEATPGV